MEQFGVGGSEFGRGYHPSEITGVPWLLPLLRSIRLEFEKMKGHLEVLQPCCLS